MAEDSLQELAKKIKQDPKQWVLILGDPFSSVTAHERKRRILELAALYQEQLCAHASFYRYVHKRDYISLADKLFGDTWNDTGSLDDSKAFFQKRREEYAGIFKQKEQINLEKLSLRPENFFGTFSGIILTICQDEQIEAFWENKNSMPADENVWTPYSVATSPKWNRWREYREDAPLEDIDAYFRNQESIIFKLYGSCREPRQMLLSRDDFELYYPENETGMPCTRLLLEKLFCSKNLLFLGADAFFLDSCGLPFAPGISYLLEKTPKDSLKRYLLLEPGRPKKGWDAYHITPVPLMENYLNELNSFSAALCRKKKKKPAAARRKASNRPLDDKNAARLFWKLYTRRPKNSISENERYILEEQILKPENGSQAGQPWSEKGIHLFSMLANNKADFYDLKKLPGPDKTWDDIRCSEDALQELLLAGLDKKSIELLQILSSYGEGFPLGFLLLLSESPEELRAWKLAGFQLTNSGIYIQRHYRAHLQRRMEYADIIMKTAGSNPGKVKMSRCIEEIEHQLDDSYFYPLDKNYFSLSSDAFSHYLMTEEELHHIFVQMFQKLLKILTDKSEGYNHIRSLLETEIKTIIHKLNELNDPRDLQWKPDLLYHLLLESRVVPPNIDDIEKQMTENLLPLKPASFPLDKKEMQNTLYLKMIIYQTKSMIESQDSGRRKQKLALDKCNEAKTFFDKAVRETTGQGLSLIPKKIFDLGFELYLFESKIHGRISSIVEMERCEKKQIRCREQLGVLHSMLSSIQKAKRLLKDRSRVTGNLYEDLWAQWYHRLGEYLFKMSQYHWENRMYLRTKKQDIPERETFYYNNALRAYHASLDYYNKFPHQYLQQRADVMRDIADLYCQRGISENNTAIRETCFDWLSDAYVLYRSNSDLHGIADVLQSMGNAEDFEHVPENTRNPMCFYNVSQDLYEFLSDRWSLMVVSKFKEGKLKSQPDPLPPPRIRI